MFSKIFFILVILYLTSCSSVTTSEKAFTIHAESLNILFFRIPGGNTRERAISMVPENGKIKTIFSIPSDLDSVIGVFNRLIGIDYTSITGTIDKN